MAATLVGVVMILAGIGAIVFNRQIARRQAIDARAQSLVPHERTLRVGQIGAGVLFIVFGALVAVHIIPIHFGR